MKTPGETLNDPTFDQWPAWLQANRPAPHGIEAGEFAEIRRSILQAAFEHTATLQMRAAELGLPEVAPAWILSVPPVAGRAVVASGHQPTVFHPGILYKCQQLTRMSAQHAALGLFVDIDTDHGDAGAFIVPGRREGRVVTEPFSITPSQAPYAFQRLPDRAALARVFDEAVKTCERGGFAVHAERVRAIAASYLVLGETVVSEANTIVRRGMEGAPPYLEVPLSHLCALPPVRAWFESLLDDADRLHTLYNESLQEFRAQRKIKSPANPFPNLKTDDGRLEMPFWSLDRATQQRSPLWIRSGEATTYSNEELIAPRGMMVSLFLRLLASDLFIHGTGGGRYDRCTDQFIARYFEIEPPRYVVSSRTRLLFAEEHAEATRLIDFAAEFRKMCAHTHKYVGTGALPEATEAAVLPVIRERQDLVAALQGARESGASVVTLSAEKRALDDRVTHILTAAFADRLEAHRAVSPAQLKGYASREFPFFLFDRDEQQVIEDTATPTSDGAGNSTPNKTRAQ